MLRYVFATGSWQTPAQQAITSLRDTVLSNDGGTLLALTTDSLRELDAVTLTQTRTTSGPVSGPNPVPLNRLALANDGIAVVTAEQFNAYYYPSGSPGFFPSPLNASATVFGALPAASDNRSLIAFIQGQLSPAPAVLKYAGSSSSLSETSLHENRISVNIGDVDPSPTVDRSGTRIAFNSSVGDTGGGTHVYDDSMALLGTLPGTTQAVAFAPNPAASAVRAYTLDACTLRAFDLTTTVAGAFVEITNVTYPITLSSCPGNHPKIVMTPDGGNAILAGDTQIVIVQTP
jgi:hypothetical protein